MRGNIKMLGWFYIIWNALGLLGGLIALTVAGLFGGLFAGVTNPFITPLCRFSPHSA